MYLYFDSDGVLKEQITASQPVVGNSNVNKIYVYWDNELTANITRNYVYCRYKKPNNDYSLNLVADDVVNEQIPYDQNRDLKFFKYFKNYKFYVFDIPDDVFEPLSDINIYSVLFSCWFIYDTNKIKTMGIVAFAVEPSTQSVLNDENINIAQWNELMKLFPDANAKYYEHLFMITAVAETNDEEVSVIFSLITRKSTAYGNVENFYLSFKEGNNLFKEASGFCDNDDIAMISVDSGDEETGLEIYIYDRNDNDEITYKCEIRRSLSYTEYIRQL